MGGIVWLASYPKSGNTWMRAFLHNLLRNADKPVPINELTQFTLGDTLKGWYEKAHGGPVDQLGPDALAGLRPKVHRLFTRAHPDSVFVKTHMKLAEMHGTSLITMNCTAGAIYIVRDPRDVALSVASHFGTDTDGAIAMLGNPQAGTVEDERNVPQYYGTWSQHVQSWTQQPNPALKVVRYEDMRAHPVRTFTEVATFLGFRPPPDRIRKAIKFSSFEELKRQERRHGFQERSDKAEAFFRAGQAGQWRRLLSEEQVARIVAAHEPVMRRFGYLP